ncbi:MAG TPA: hypothetical protein PKH98_06775, partial [Candidatus Omnitrophota bacterium]|nr:hypothetical protein [Candidatus Omnitrophota bacterium]
LHQNKEFIQDENTAEKIATAVDILESLPIVKKSLFKFLENLAKHPAKYGFTDFNIKNPLSKFHRFIKKLEQAKTLGDTKDILELAALLNPTVLFKEYVDLLVQNKDVVVFRLVSARADWTFEEAQEELERIAQEREENKAQEELAESIEKDIENQDKDDNDQTPPTQIETAQEEAIEESSEKGPVEVVSADVQQDEDTIETKESLEEVKSEKLKDSFFKIVGNNFFTKALQIGPVQIGWTFPLVGTLASLIDGGFTAFLVIFTSVFLHEIAHGLMAIKQGGDFKGIGLHGLWAEAKVTTDYMEKSEKRWISLAGPLTNLLIANIAYFLGASMDMGTINILTVNLGLGVFNL